MKYPNKKQITETLDRVEKRRAILSSSVSHCVAGFTPAFFLWGAPGLGKSHTLRECLKDLGKDDFVHHTAYTTPKGLMLGLAERPEALHVVEDCERVLKTDLSASILRAACGDQGDGGRWVTYETAHEKLRIKMTGAVIIVTNQNLSRTNGPMQGVASRFRPMKWELTPDEVACVIAKATERGWIRRELSLSSVECRHVAETLFELCDSSSSGVPLDLRLYFEHALTCYAAGKLNKDDNWADVLSAKMSGNAETADSSRAERRARLQRIALEVDAMEVPFEQKMIAWMSKSGGLGQAMFYRHVTNAKKS